MLFLLFKLVVMEKEFNMRALPILFRPSFLPHQPLDLSYIIFNCIHSPSRPSISLLLLSLVFFLHFWDRHSHRILLMGKLQIDHPLRRVYSQHVHLERLARHQIK